MDSITHFALGAGIGAAVLGRRLGLRKAALTGGVIASLPDLDVFWPYDDPVDFFVSHRGATHSLILQTLVTPLLGEALRRLYGALKEHRAQAYLAAFLCLITHALADYFTIYGTQLFWPIWPEPLGLGSIFIIDPLLSMPLLIVMVWAFLRGRWTPRFARFLTWAFVISGAYLGWSVIAQQIAQGRAERVLAKNGIEYRQLMTTPMPFNTLFWRAIALDGSRYYNVYLPMFGGDQAATVYVQQRWPEDLACWVERSSGESGVTKTLVDFADGFYLVGPGDGTVQVADLRMGLSHTYVFRFDVADNRNGVITPTTPRRVGAVRQLPGDLEWLWAGIRGQKTVRPVERAALVTDGKIRLATAAKKKPKKC